MTPTPTPTLSEVVEAADLQLHPETRRTTSRSARAAALRSELAWAVETATTDLDFARDYQRHMPHPSTTPQDYLDRWVTVAPDLHTLLGPRHRRRDPARRFVAVDAASRPIRREDLPALRAACRAEFSRFAPRSVVFWDWQHPDRWPEATPDMRLLAASLGDLRRRPVPTDLTLAPAHDMSFYDRYREGYDELLERRPEAREWTRPEEFADLEDLQQQDLVLEARVDDRWAGVIAGQPAARAGLRGIEVTEVFLLPGFRGHGWGSGLSVALARHVALPEDDFLLGTIHWHNLAARSAALAAGRRDLGGEVVVPLTDDPVASKTG